MQSKYSNSNDVYIYNITSDTIIVQVIFVCIFSFIQKCPGTDQIILILIVSIVQM